MRLILLPGMDGSGELFAPLLPYLADDYTVISLPQSGVQDYATLTAFVEQQLPDEPYVLLAESFSGPIADRIAMKRPDHLAGAIFVVTFLSPPAPWLASIANALPLKKLLRLPFSSLAIRGLFLGNADKLLLQLFRRLLERIPEAVLQRRIQAIGELENRDERSTLPALYIQARGDRLVPEGKWFEFEQRFNKARRVIFDGPHCILQRRPVECAEVIIRFIEKLNSTP
jgi:pimeloyl-ACP methyl ester carboxylesterase